MTLDLLVLTVRQKKLFLLEIARALNAKTRKDNKLSDALSFAEEVFFGRKDERYVRMLLTDIREKYYRTRNRSVRDMVRVVEDAINYAKPDSFFPHWLNDSLLTPYNENKIEHYEYMFPCFIPTWLRPDDWNDPYGVCRPFAASIYQRHAFDESGVLADMLEENSYPNEDLLAHLRSTNTHYMGCRAYENIVF